MSFLQRSAARHPRILFALWMAATAAIPMLAIMASNEPTIDLGRIRAYLLAPCLAAGVAGLLFGRMLFAQSQPQATEKRWRPNPFGTGAIAGVASYILFIPIFMAINFKSAFSDPAMGFALYALTLGLYFIPLVAGITSFSAWLFRWIASGDCYRDFRAGLDSD